MSCVWSNSQSIYGYAAWPPSNCPPCFADSRFGVSLMWGIAALKRSHGGKATQTYLGTWTRDTRSLFTRIGDCVGAFRGAWRVWRPMPFTKWDADFDAAWSE